VYCFNFRNEAEEMKLKLADTYLKLGEIGMETGIKCTTVVTGLFSGLYVAYWCVSEA